MRQSFPIIILPAKSLNSLFIMRDKKTFTIAFPTISDLDVTVTESGKGLSKYIKSTFTQATITKTIKCSNPACYKGGLNIAMKLWEMVTTQSTHFEAIVKCNGLEGTPLSKRKRNPCLNEFNYTIDLKYNAPESN